MAATAGEEFLYISTEDDAKSAAAIGLPFAEDLDATQDRQDQPQDPQDPPGLLSPEDDEDRKRSTTDEAKAAEDNDEDNDEDVEEEEKDEEEDEEEEEEEVIDGSEVLRRRYVGYSDLPFVPDDVTIVDLIRGHVAVNCRGQEVQIPVLMSLMLMSIIGLSPATFFVSIGVGLPLAWLVQSSLRWATKAV
jgi:hypothetical protein